MFDREKFKRLVHYVIWKAGRRDNFGSTKLNKVLWFADARTYLIKGQSITGATYIREKFGPVPKAIMAIRDELVSDGNITIIPGKSRYDLTAFLANTKPNLEIISEEELKTIDYWINHIDSDHTATSISEFSHDYAWEIARMGEELPFYSALAERVRDPKGKELEWAKSVAASLEK